MSSRSARSAHELQEADLQTAAVWRFVSLGELQEPDVDESFVTPEMEAPWLGHFGSYLIAAEYQLRNGKSLPGLVQVGILGTKVEFMPACIFAAGKSVEALGRDTEARLRRLLKVAGAQPDRWRLSVVLKGETEPRSGQIAKPGFLQALGLLSQLARLKSLRGGGSEA